MEIDWLKPFAGAWRDRVRHGRVPHALMLLGPPGVGKRSAAVWLARERLGLPGADGAPRYPVSVPEHADLRWLAPPEDKHTIGIEQVRDLVAALSLTSYEGGNKVAVIEPANAMTANAANSLLKTLEEPPGAALLILVADRVGHLPATIMSRCQRLSLALPPTAASLKWLDRLEPSADWPQALRLAGDAPLAAIEARGRLAQAASMAEEFAQLATGAGSPVEVAARWARHDPGFVLDWLGNTVQSCIRRGVGGDAGQPPSSPPDSVLRRIDRRNLFCYLDIINGLRGQAPGSYNPQLTFESLLIDWASGLQDCRQIDGLGDTLPVTVSR